MSYERLQSMYAGEEYYWGREPNGFARRALELLPESGKNAKPRAVDIGAGEGRDAVFFAENGLDTLAVDVSQWPREGAPSGPRTGCRAAGSAGRRQHPGDRGTFRPRLLYRHDPVPVAGEPPGPVRVPQGADLPRRLARPLRLRRPSRPGARPGPHGGRAPVCPRGAAPLLCRVGDPPLARLRVRRRLRGRPAPARGRGVRLRDPFVGAGALRERVA